MMDKRINAILHQEWQLEPAKPLLVGVSGGPDSLCLLDLLVKERYEITIAHLNHSLREDADIDAEYVKKIAQKYRLPMIYDELDVKHYASKNSLSVEAAARVLRYRFLFDRADKIGAQAVLVGHTADDQVETIMLHILRGTGLQGLQGMPVVSMPNQWSETIPLIRPLLMVWRSEVLAYLAEREIHPVIDSSNKDQRYMRNRIRHELFPFLESYNPAFKKSLFRMANILEGDYQLITSIVDATWLDCVLKTDDDYVIFQKEKFLSQHRAMQRHLLRKGVAAVRQHNDDLDFRTINDAVEFIRNPIRSRSRILLDDVSIYLRNDHILLASDLSKVDQRNWPMIDSDTIVKLAVPQIHNFAGGWQLHIDRLRANSVLLAEIEQNSDLFSAWFDAAKLQFPLWLRTRKAGDRMAPLGMQHGRMKISNLMINQKIPQSVRSKIPILVSGEEIIWVPGIQIAQSVRITQKTESILQMQFSKIE
ncbi:MAG: tRNA lysidine(34) synthetase TilS [Anaerolineales bacterium]|nr:tRNA lysidine(34) synthetase TilS [Anaerolineales bacterium]